MKKIYLISFLITFSITGQAQDSKPTKEETVQYIMDYFDEKFFILQCEEGNDVFISRAWYYNFLMKFDYSTSIFNIEYQYGAYKSEKVKMNYQIDMSKVESLSLYSESECLLEKTIQHPLQIVFTSSKKFPIIDMISNETFIQFKLPFDINNPKKLSTDKKIIKSLELLNIYESFVVLLSLLIFK